MRPHLSEVKASQSYVTVIVDSEARRVIDVEEGRNAETVEIFSEKLEEKGGSCAEIKIASSDLSGAYRAGIELCFPQVRHTVDKFHVKKLMLDAMDEVRKSEQRETKSRALHLGRRTLMVAEGKQTEEQKQKVEKLCKEFPKTGRAFRMVQALDVVYASRTPEEAHRQFKALYGWLQHSRLEPMKKVAATLKKYKEEILNIFTTRVTNAI